jgi:hypothetical protein
MVPRSAPDAGFQLSWASSRRHPNGRRRSHSIALPPSTAKQPVGRFRLPCAYGRGVADPGGSAATRWSWCLCGFLHVQGGKVSAVRHCNARWSTRIPRAASQGMLVERWRGHPVPRRACRGCYWGDGACLALAYSHQDLVFLFNIECEVRIYRIDLHLRKGSGFDSPAQRSGSESRRGV